MLIASALLAAGSGIATVFVGDLFPDRPIFFAALPLVILIGLAVALDPRRLLVALVLLRGILDPVFTQATLPGFGGLGGLVNFVIIALALILFAGARGKLPRASWLPWLPFLVVIFAAVVRSPDHVYAVRGWLTLCTYAAAYHGAFYCVRNNEDLDRVLRWMLLSSVLVAVYAVGSFAIYGPAYVVEAGEATSGRLSNPMVHPNILGFYMVVMLGAWFAKVRSRPLGPPLTLRSIAWFACLLLILGVLIGTQTRSAWFGALVLILAYGLLVNRLYLVLIVAGVLGALLVPDIRDRVLDLASNNEVYTYSKLNSYAWRRYIWSSALGYMSLFSYLVGNGQGAFWVQSAIFFPLSNNEHWNAHNVYVQLLFDSGIVGLLSYIAVFAMASRELWKRKALRFEARAMSLTLLACFVFMSYSDNMLDYLPVNWNLWFLIGLVVAAATQSQSQSKSIPQEVRA